MLLSGKKYLWKMPQDIDKAIVANFAAKYNLAYPVVQTLLSRGYDSEQKINDFVFSVLDRSIFDASIMKDARKAALRIIDAINKQEKILIFGDYDVDGITSTSMMLCCLLPLGATINFFLPNRVKDGYGLSSKIVTRAAKNNYSVIITVDNGITAFEPAQEAKKLGIDLIITDHHKPHEILPDAYAIVNPHQNDCPYPYKELAGVGVTFKLLSLVYELLSKSLPEKVYELLTLGTVADVVPLTGENRYWVKHGLQQISKHDSFSIQVLKSNAKVTKDELTSLDVGFF